MPIHIILDTDLAMGELGSEIDDGFALALAHADEGITIDMITTVHGNTDVESATRLSLQLCERLGLKDTPIHKGTASRLTDPCSSRQAKAKAPASIDHSHRHPTPGYAAIAIIEHILAHPGEITLVCIGPLTNIATALIIEPRIVSALREIVIMGGLFFGITGDRSMLGEFNVWSDPEAARAVLNSGAKQRWVGLDVTEKTRITRVQARTMVDGGRSFGVFAGEATLAWIDRLDKNREEKRDSCAIHDALAVAVVTHPELCEWADVMVDVRTEDGLRGMMVTDRREGRNPPPANCTVATSVKAEAFVDRFLALVSDL